MGYVWRKSLKTERLVDTQWPHFARNQPLEYVWADMQKSTHSGHCEGVNTPPNNSSEFATLQW
jgi:hypothetical protein